MTPHGQIPASNPVETNIDVRIYSVYCKPVLLYDIVARGGVALLKCHLKEFVLLA